MAGLENNFPVSLKLASVQIRSPMNTIRHEMNKSSQSGSGSCNKQRKKNERLFNAFYIIANTWRSFWIDRNTCALYNFQESDDIDKSQYKQIKKHFNLYRHIVDFHKQQFRCDAMCNSIYHVSRIHLSFPIFIISIFYFQMYDFIYFASAHRIASFAATKSNCFYFD